MKSNIISKIRKNFQENKELNGLLLNELTDYFAENFSLYYNIIKFMRNKEDSLHKEKENLALQYLQEQQNLEEKFKENNKKLL